MKYAFSNKMIYYPSMCCFIHTIILVYIPRRAQNWNIIFRFTIECFLQNMVYMSHSLFTRIHRGIMTRYSLRVEFFLMYFILVLLFKYKKINVRYSNVQKYISINIHIYIYSIYVYESFKYVV